MGEIIDLIAREVIDSRGNPTIEVEVLLESGATGRTSVPSGASTGEKEALELRDGGKRFHGKGVQRAVRNVFDKIAPKLRGLSSENQCSIDNLLLEIDGTDNKSRLGANAILGVSLAICKATSKELGIPLYRYLGGCNAKVLPVPMMNILNGGAHADNNLDIQEFMIIPTGFSDFASALRAGSEIFHTLKSVLKKRRLSTSVGDEGGFAPNLNANEEALSIILQAITESGYDPKKDVLLAIDVASSEFYKNGKYHFEGKSLTSYEMVDYYDRIVKKYPILSIEDGMAENDWEGWKKLTDRLGKKIQLVGDDIFVTNTKIIKKGIKKGIANSVLIKLNQIGTVTETLEAIEMAKSAGYTAIISHRSGETEDTAIADLAVSCNTGFIKTGSVSRGERTSKYNRLLRIEEELMGSALYKGIEAFYHLQ